MPNDESSRCRVCGLLQSAPPWGANGNEPTFEICDCCGVEFGYEDSTPSSASRYRQAWLARGSPWFEPKERPANWSLGEQLRHVPLVYPDAGGDT